jgi:hypothetical protein
MATTSLATAGVVRSVVNLGSQRSERVEQRVAEIERLVKIID